MRAYVRALRYAALLLLVTVFSGCKRPDVLVLVADNHPTINLFGFEESELHHIHNTVELHRNIFLVRYDPEKPNAIEWVNCPIDATYSYRQANGRRVESIYIKSVQELQAKVPVNYARFAGHIKNGKALEFNYVTIGSYELLGDFRIPKDDPDCARATHYVVTLSVGAFNFNEQKVIEGGIEASEANTGIGVGVGAGRESGERTAMGDLDDCMDDTAALNGCFTPLQLMMMPLANRHWVDAAAEAPSTRVAQASHSSTTASDGTEVHQVGGDLSLHVDVNAWQPGSYMAMALQNLLLVASRIDVSSDFGFDDKGSTVMAGYLRANKPQKSARLFEAGKTYVVIGASATGSNIDLTIRDSQGNLVAADTEQDSAPTTVFTPPTTDNYSIELSLVGASEEFGAVVVMQDGGIPVDVEILQGVFQRLLDAGTMVSAKVQEMGFENGLIFHEGDWAVQGTILYGGEAIRQSGIHLGGTSAVFVAVSHEESLNVDLEVIDANTGQSWSDMEPDSNPVVIIEEPDTNTSYDLRLIYGAGESATLATSLILQL